MLVTMTINTCDAVAGPRGIVCAIDNPSSNAAAVEIAPLWADILSWETSNARDFSNFIGSPYLTGV
jgi:hypothetical protein